MTTSAPPNTSLTARERKDLEVLALFSRVYCRAHHGGAKAPLTSEDGDFADSSLEKYPLCAECREFLAYAIARRRRCPLDPKPVCKHCPAPCYRPGHREKVREIMRFSGKYLILRGRFDLLWHYFF